MRLANDAIGDTREYFDELARIKDSDWIIEAIVEQLEIKQGLLEKVDAVRRPGSIVSSNTSVIPIAALAAAIRIAVASASHRSTFTGDACRSATAPKINGETNAASADAA